jgi:phosphocarrier protein HPr
VIANAVRSYHMTAPDGAIARRQVEITYPLGLHLRAANTFATLARSFRAETRVSSDGKEADGKSILDLLTLAAACGSVLDLEARGPDAEAVVAALVELVQGGFNETVERSHGRTERRMC